MPNKLSIEKRRVSYAEWHDSWDAVEILAHHKHVTPTEIIRQAVLDYITDHAKDIETTRKRMAAEAKERNAEARELRAKRDKVKRLIKPESENR